MRREVVEVYSFVCAACCEEDFLGLVWDRRRWRREGKTTDRGCMGIE